MSNDTDDDFILELQKQFFLDCKELFSTAESSLIEFESSQSKEALKALLRSLHSIKGGARAVGFDALAIFMHEMESQIVQQNNSIDINYFLKKLDSVVEHVNLLAQNKHKNAEDVLKKAAS